MEKVEITLPFRSFAVMNQVRLVVFLVISSLILLSGCNPTGDAGSPLEYEISDADTLLPFRETGELIWDSSDFNNLYLDFWQERKDYEALTSQITSQADIRKFVSILTEIRKTLVYTEKASDTFDKITDNGVFPSELGDLYFHFGPTLPDNAFLQVFRAADCGYLWFRLENNESGTRRYHSSIFSIGTNDFENLESFLNSLPKQQEALVGKPVLYLYPEHEADVTVRLRFEGTLSVTYPAYENEWSARAYPD